MKQTIKDWYGREGYGECPRSKRKKDFVRQQAQFQWNWLRSRGRHDIADASNQQKGWGHRNWSLLDMPRKGWRARLLGRVARRIAHEERARHSHACYAATPPSCPSTEGTKK